MIRILFLNRRFDYGGAERQLIELVKGLDKTRFEVSLATFYDGGGLRQEIEAVEGVKLISLRKKARWDLLSFLWQLWRVARRHDPQIIHGYLDVANILSLLVGRSLGATVVWGMRASYMDLSHYDWLLGLSFRLERLLARSADLIIVNSKAGHAHHVARGFPADKMVVIPNGIDTERFNLDAKAGAEVRAEWGIPEDTTLIGLVARLDPMKDHWTFLKAAALLCKERDDVRFVCVGGGPECYARELRQFAEDIGVSDKVLWTGSRVDMPAIYNALSITTSSSYGEGFPNTIGEAMACGVPCVVTDAGDSAWIVGDTGVVVPRRDPEALAGAWGACLRRDLGDMGRRARARVVEHFSLKQLVQQTEKAILATN